MGLAFFKWLACRFKLALWVFSFILNIYDVLDKALYLSKHTADIISRNWCNIFRGFIIHLWFHSGFIFQNLPCTYQEPFVGCLTTICQNRNVVSIFDHEKRNSFVSLIFVLQFKIAQSVKKLNAKRLYKHNSYNGVRCFFWLKF